MTSVVPGQAPGDQAAQERQPAGAVLGGDHVEAEHLPVALARSRPTAMTTATLTMRPPSRTFWVSASSHTYV